MGISIQNSLYVVYVYIIIFCIVSAQAQEVAKSAQSHMYNALTAKRNTLVEHLEAKVKRYKELQMKEIVRSPIRCNGIQCYIFILLYTANYCHSYGGVEWGHHLQPGEQETKPV